MILQGGGGGAIPPCSPRSSLTCKVLDAQCLDLQISQEAMEQLKTELEEVIQALNKRLEELQNLAKEQQDRIGELEQEGEDLRVELAHGKDAQEALEETEQKLQCKSMDRW